MLCSSVIEECVRLHARRTPEYPVENRAACNRGRVRPCGLQNFCFPAVISLDRVSATAMKNRPARARAARRADDLRAVRQVTVRIAILDDPRPTTHGRGPSVPNPFRQGMV